MIIRVMIRCDGKCDRNYQGSDVAMLRCAIQLSTAQYCTAQYWLTAL
jgi:hypothetical protein